LSGLGASEAERALLWARTAAQEAGQLLLERYERLEVGEVRSKSSARDLVTAADLASERLLVASLRQAFPEHAIQAEEEVRDAGRRDVGACWYLDPLDGTLGFVHGLPQFAVSLGLCVDGRPEVGVVHLPRMEECFWARRGHGAWLSTRGAEPRRLSVSGCADLQAALLATGLPKDEHLPPDDNMADLQSLVPLSKGLRQSGAAAYDLAYTAAGRLDAYWDLHLAPHDVAAGGLLVLEAGGAVGRLDGGEDWLHGGQILAGPAQLCERIRERSAQARGQT